MQLMSTFVALFDNCLSNLGYPNAISPLLAIMLKNPLKKWHISEYFSWIINVVLSHHIH